MTVTNFPAPFVVDPVNIRKCSKCQQEILWLTSYKNGKNYTVDVKLQNARLESCRNWFHRCAPVQLQLIEQTLVPPARYCPLNDSKAQKKLAMVLFIDKASLPQLLMALQTIFKRQTTMEQNRDITTDHNGIGFGGSDAEILSAICKSATKYGGLRGKQVELVRRKMKKYARQLVEALENGEWRI